MLDFPGLNKLWFSFCRHTKIDCPSNASILSVSSVNLLVFLFMLMMGESVRNLNLLFLFFRSFFWKIKETPKRSFSRSGSIKNLISASFSYFYYKVIPDKMSVCLLSFYFLFIMPMFFIEVIMQCSLNVCVTPKSNTLALLVTDMDRVSTCA